MSDALDGLGAIWTCDNCGARTETALDDEPAGWLVDEPDEDDYPDDVEIPIDFLICGDCRFPATLATSDGAGETRGGR